MRKNRPNWLLIIGAFVLLAGGVYFIPPVRERVDYRLDQMRIQVRDLVNPPEKAVFVPQQDLTQPAIVNTATPVPTISRTAAAIEPTITPTIDPATLATPLPPFSEIKGVRYIDQHNARNYCAPSTLAMGLSHWGWRGTREDVARVIKPYDDDYNVMPYEMENFAKNNANLQAVTRIGGTTEILKTMVAGGFPVLIEKGVYLRDLADKVSWMGHYNLVTGYDDNTGEFIAQDSYLGPNHRFKYKDLEDEWRSFNFLFMVIYPAEQEEKVMDLLGIYRDEEAANRLAYERATVEIGKFFDINQYFAWFNRGTSMVRLQDYSGAANAYDQAFALYQTLPEDTRPFRMVWYQTGPYYAYYYTNRFQDVINLADLTLSLANHPGLEESNYWRAMGYVAVGNTKDALTDLKLSLKIHPGFEPSEQLLQQIGGN
jgi:tetratricopeptide (TPR) repeat protein